METKPTTTDNDCDHSVDTSEEDVWIETASVCCASLVLRRDATVYESAVVEEALRKILRRPSAKEKCFASVEGRMMRCSLPFGHDGQHCLEPFGDGPIFSD